MPQKRGSHTLTGSSIVLLLPDLSVNVNDGWHYENINIYLQYLRAKNLYCHLFIVADTLIDTAKRASSDIFPYGWYCHEIIRTHGVSQTKGSRECACEACIFIIRVGDFLEHRIKFKLLRLHRMFSYLQTVNESKGIVVADRCIFLDYILGIASDGIEISAIVINVSRQRETSHSGRFTHQELRLPWRNEVRNAKKNVYFRPYIYKNP